MSRPGSRVIDARWETHHRPVAEGTLTALCTIDGPGVGPGTWNAETNKYDPPERIVLHAGIPCRVQQWKMPQLSTTGTQQVTTRDYRVSVPIAIVDAAPDQRVTVTGGDPSLDQSLIGRALVVIDVQRGTLAWERDLICIDNMG